MTVKSPNSKQVLETSHEREMLVCSVLTVLTVGASGCSVINDKLTIILVKYVCSMQMYVAYREDQRNSNRHKLVVHL